MFDAPAIESALLTWMNNRRRDKNQLNDRGVIGQARKFARMCGLRETAVYDSHAWLEGLKRKYVAAFHPHKEPTSPESQSHSCTPAGTDCLTVDRSDTQRLDEETCAVAGSGAAFSVSPTGGIHAGGINQRVISKSEVKGALDTVRTYFEYHGDGLNVMESRDIATLRRSLE